MFLISGILSRNQRKIKRLDKERKQEGQKGRKRGEREKGTETSREEGGKRR